MRFYNPKKLTTEGGFQIKLAHRQFISQYGSGVYDNVACIKNV